MVYITNISMKYIVHCNLSENSIKDIIYFHQQNVKILNSLRAKQNFFIPIINFNGEHYDKIKNSISKNISKLETFRVNISKFKNDSNKNLYMLIEQKGFLCTIQRIFEEELIQNKIKNYEILSKWDHFYIDYANSKNNIDINSNINFPNFIKVNSVNICTVSYKKINIIDSINLRNI